MAEALAPAAKATGRRAPRAFHRLICR